MPSDAAHQMNKSAKKLRDFTQASELLLKQIGRY
jgi:hypothetical protein